MFKWLYSFRRLRQPTTTRALGQSDGRAPARSTMSEAAAHALVAKYAVVLNAMAGRKDVIENINALPASKSVLKEAFILLTRLNLQLPERAAVFMSDYVKLARFQEGVTNGNPMAPLLDQLTASPFQQILAGNQSVSQDEITRRLAIFDAHQKAMQTESWTLLKELKDCGLLTDQFVVLPNLNVQFVPGRAAGHP